jgi:hypothetical protein
MLTTRKNKDTGEETQALDGGFTRAAPATPRSQPTPTPPWRPGILGYVADRVTSVLSGR